MIFWLVCLVLTFMVAALVIRPLLRPVQAVPENPDVALYKAQLAEIDRDVAREVLAAEEAEQARTEVARRLLAASKATAPTAQNGPAMRSSILITLLVLGISFGTYYALGAPGYGDLPLQARLDASDAMRKNRPSQAALEAAAPTPPPTDVPEEYSAAVAQLRTIAPTRPDDIEAWSRLAFHEVELRNYAGAARAQKRVIEIKGDDAGTADRQRLLDLLVVAAGGFVSPEAEALINQMLNTDENNTAARYYLGMLYNQTDRPDIAYRMWRGMAESGDPQSFHVASARAQIEDAAYRAGIDYTLPDIRGPSAADIANAENMTAEERQQMIGMMVAGLADRLATEGGTAADWARLIRAYGVLGDQEAAGAVWAEARGVFGASTEAMDVLTAAADAAGVRQ
ncbi:c-type cytochrome biogenesis protein CcmI [Loktanella agnita]|uniref:c-type cytochrome biogenesis protein CcmI n=1 Tax=Loktanella agnita TaxID=287097 RepID=UPI003987E315